MTSFQQARTRDDLRWMARFTAATVLTADVTILDEFLSWLGRVLSDKVPVPRARDLGAPGRPTWSSRRRRSGRSCCTRRPTG